MFIKNKILDFFNLVDRAQNLFEVAHANYLKEENERLLRRNMELEADNNILRLRVFECELRIDKLILGE